MDRRYDAKTTTCGTCGPRLMLLGWQPGEKEPRLLVQPGPREEQFTAIQQAMKFVADGGILVIKLIAGAHLVCLASKPEPIRVLRQWKKKRETKPFALMARDLVAVSQFADISSEEKILLSSFRRPIVLMEKRRDPQVPIELDLIAPGLHNVGVMLPYAGTHHLMFECLPDEIALIMTSANETDMPMFINNYEIVSANREQKHRRKQLGEFQRRGPEAFMEEVERAAGGPPLTTTSTGRVLDALAVLLEVKTARQYSGELPMLLESASKGAQITDHFRLSLPEAKPGEPLVIPTSDLFAKMITAIPFGDEIDVERRAELAVSAQAGLAIALADAAIRIAHAYKLTNIGFSGGVAYNDRIVSTFGDQVEAAGLTFLQHAQVPPGDAGQAVGQAAYAAACLLR